MITLVILPFFSFNVAFSIPPISKLWLDADTVILGIVDSINLVNHTDLYDIYDVWVIVAEYLQDVADELYITVRYYDFPSNDNERSITFEKAERVILFLNASNPKYYTIVSSQGKFTFGDRGYENIYGETINPRRDDTSILVIGLSSLLIISLIVPFLFKLKKYIT